ncbi:hypothetical protein B0H14DRAFT_3662282 [Mycena olivaceomarginata]|nr:hypothetical protein B0H14DRAFT_3662282 [Mycena olivaceomarginata]
MSLYQNTRKHSKTDINGIKCQENNRPGRMLAALRDQKLEAELALSVKQSNGFSMLRGLNVEVSCNAKSFPRSSAIDVKSTLNSDVSASLLSKAKITEVRFQQLLSIEPVTMPDSSLMKYASVWWGRGRGLTCGSFYTLGSSATVRAGNASMFIRFVPLRTRKRLQTQRSSLGWNGFGIFHSSSSRMEMVTLHWELNVYLDTVTIGGVVIPKQAVELAQKMSAQLSSGEGNGRLLCLACPAIHTVSPKLIKTPWQSVIEQGLIFQPLFSVHCKLDCGDSTGFYSFSEIDETVTSNLITHPWTDHEREANTAILNTGSVTLFLFTHLQALTFLHLVTLALVDDAAVSKIYKTAWREEREEMEAKLEIEACRFESTMLTKHLEVLYHHLPTII